MEQKSKFSNYIVIIAILLIIIIVNFSRNTQDKHSGHNTSENSLSANLQSPILIGNTYHTKATTYACPTKEGFGKMMHLLSVNDLKGIENMKWAVELVVLPKSTPLYITKISGDEARGRIDTGQYKGDEVYVISTALE